MSRALFGQAFLVSIKIKGPSHDNLPGGGFGSARDTAYIYHRIVYHEVYQLTKALFVVELHPLFPASGAA